MRSMVVSLLLVLAPSMASAAAVDVELVPTLVRQGGIFMVTVSGPERPRLVTCRVDGRPLVVFDGEVLGTRRALGACSWDEPPGLRTVTVGGLDCDGRPFERHLSLTVVSGGFPRETLKVAPRMAVPPPDVQERIRREAALLKGVMSTTSESMLAGAFVRPVPGIVMSPFGSQRTFNGKVASRHSGVDLRGAAGRPVAATNGGRVVLARSLYFAGTTVVVDHGMGLFSLYAHLKTLDVAEGEYVERGQVVGRVGATGRVTGPHLHWGMKLGWWPLIPGTKNCGRHWRPSCTSPASTVKRARSCNGSWTRVMGMQRYATRSVMPSRNWAGSTRPSYTGTGSPTIRLPRGDRSGHWKNSPSIVQNPDGSAEGPRMTHDCASCHPAPTPSRALASTRALVVQVAFVAGAVAVLLCLGESPEIKTLSIVFISIVLEAFPFMLLGALLGGLIEVFVSRDRLLGSLPKRAWLTVLVAAGLGLVMPVCECAVVPVVRRLLRKGVPFAAAVAYLLGGPITNPLVAGSTAVAYLFDWKVVVLRLAFGYAVAVGVGLSVGRMFTDEEALLPAVSDEPSCGCGHDHSVSPDEGASVARRFHAALVHGAEDFVDIGRFLVIGAFVAAMIQTIVTRQAFVVLSGQPWLAILVMMGLAVTLNLCSEADAFVAASFKSLMPLSAQLSFMVLGPMVDVKLLLMYLGVFRKRAIIAIAASTCFAVFTGMLLFHYVMAAGGGR